jgi:hypothetical protein
MVLDEDGAFGVGIGSGFTDLVAGRPRARLEQGDRSLQEKQDRELAEQLQRDDRDQRSRERTGNRTVQHKVSPSSMEECSSFALRY